jgi:hypothetical protein
MDSRSPHADFARRGLGSRRGLRRVAIALWTGFLGGALTLLAGVALLPDVAGLGWAGLSVGFLCAWALATVPAALALLLADGGDGR